ncbi:S4 domain-containing protein YaaA [Vagococcus elongatus]|uniref:RNA-binding protein n=1 Tax=Vagococcus elongatus TaxID=180344 RepID=A0A430AUY3_9ENTE|nr:S4 domain-containing protein YaaA [Vagococcus elongatus]RSU11870.1 RNA-binding protein [Vagococcus elongatus]
MKKKFIIQGEFITLGQFLKEVDQISSGGMAKWYLQEHAVFVDGELENRRGKKLYPGTMVELPDGGIFFMAKNPETPLSNEELTDEAD